MQNSTSPYTMMDLPIPRSSEPDILPFLQKVFPSVTSCSIFQTIVQPNAVGYKVQLEPTTKSSDSSHPDKVFFKSVAAADHVPNRKDWSDLRRLLMYCRTEARFYRDFAPKLAQKGFHAVPTPLLAHYNMDGWIPDEELATADAADPDIDKDALPDREYKGCVLILEYIPETNYYQDSPLSMEQAKQCLAAAAELHAAAWQDTELLKAAETQLSKASFNLSMRNPKELEGVEEAWDHFVNEFKQDMVEHGIWNDTSVANLGSRIKRAATYICSQVSPSPTDPHATMIHGDYKAMNVFLPKHTTKQNNNAVLVDYASAAIGLGMSDVAMHIHHAVLPENLENGGELELVRYYWNELTNSRSIDDYPYEAALRDYKLCTVDYFRFFLGRMWKIATHDTMKDKENNKNIANINRFVKAACAYVGRVDKYLAEIEGEMKEGSDAILNGRG